MFKYFDVGLTGRLDYNQFFAAMTRLNFVGVQVRSSINCSVQMYKHDVVSLLVERPTFCSRSCRLFAFSRRAFSAAERRKWTAVAGQISVEASV